MIINYSINTIKIIIYKEIIFVNFIYVYYLLIYLNTFEYLLISK